MIPGLLNTKRRILKMLQKIVRERKYPYYDIRDELWENPEPGKPPVFMRKLAYTKTGDWIGSSKEAYRKVHNLGITEFEKTDPGHCVCSIGFAPEKELWFGWSHRMMASFGVGSTCKKGDCAYRPATFPELMAECENKSEGNDCRASAFLEAEAVNPEEPEGELITVGPVRGVMRCLPENCVYEIGKGEWTAHTIQDAKQMAIDFAGSVS